jgi:hypothetical protein
MRLLKRFRTPLLLVSAVALGWLVRDHAARAAAANRVFELRTYTAAEGKLPNLEARFRNHTVKLFEKHGITNIGYWTPQDGPLKGNTLIYLLAHPDRDTAKKNFDAFRANPAWLAARKESESAAGGSLTTKVESLFLEPTDFSPLK